MITEGEKTIERILEAAYQMSWKSGYHGVLVAHLPTLEMG